MRSITISVATVLMTGSLLGLLTAPPNFVLNEKASGPPGQPILSADCQTQIKHLIKREQMTFDQL
jgi:hypothetical protein